MTGADRRRALVMRALHAEGARRGLDHDGLRDVAAARFQAASMSALSLKELAEMYLGLTGQEFLFHQSKSHVTLPPRGITQSCLTELVSGEELELLERAFAARGWGNETKKAFIRRQLRGLEQIRTRADFQRVFRGVQAMNRRDGIENPATGRVRGEAELIS